MRILLASFAFLCFLPALPAQDKHTDIYSGYVRYLSSSTTGTITVISTGFAKKRAESIKDAYKEAFYAILFRGIPGSQLELPMIPNEQEKKNDPAVVALLEGGILLLLWKQRKQERRRKKREKTEPKEL